MIDAKIAVMIGLEHCDLGAGHHEGGDDEPGHRLAEAVLAEPPFEGALERLVVKLRPQRRASRRRTGQRRPVGLLLRSAVYCVHFGLRCPVRLRDVGRFFPEAAARRWGISANTA